jgi:uncharacterized membrane protein (DUF373 family)
MQFKKEFVAARARWALLTLYQKFEHAVVLLLTALIAVVVALAVWNLTLKILSSVLSSGFDPSDYAVFQVLFGMIFTVMIALEFRRSLLVLAERRRSIVQVRTVILIALLAIVRKLLILDLSTTGVEQLFGLAAAILALGIGSSAIRIGASRRRENSHVIDVPSLPVFVEQGFPRDKIPDCAARE